MKRLILVLLICLLPLSALAEQLLLDPGETKGFGENSIKVTSPGEGSLLLRVRDAYHVYRTLTAQVQAGENVIPWDGLAENQEQIVDRTYTLEGVLTLPDGSTVTAETEFSMGRCHQAMTYALPSSDTLYQAGESWFLEMDMVRPGTYAVDVYAAEDMMEPVQRIRKSVTGYEPFRYQWKGNVAPGSYVLRCYAEKNPDYAYDVAVTVREGSEPEIPLTVTDRFMPAADDDETAVWQTMMQPSAVVDIGKIAHQKVYAQPSEQSTVLGTLHGQSQAVNVLALGDDGWATIRAWNHEEGAPVEGYVPADRLKMVQPNAAFGLLLNKTDQTLDVYHRGKKLTTLKVSTGLMAKDKLFRETPAGSYLTLEHMSDFASEGYYYDYPIRYDGGNLLHQLGYKKRSGRNDFADQTPQLGSKASHGCIRLPNQVNGDGVNAYWLWTHLPYHTRLIILDDPELRPRQAAMAQAGRSTAAAALAEAQEVPALQAEETEIVLTLGGDAVLGTREAWWKQEDALPAYLEREGMAYPFSGLKEIFAADDMTFINLECVLKSDRSGEKTDKQWRFRGLPGYTEVLALGSVEQVNIANNHYIDYDARGKKATREALEAAGIPFSGYGYVYAWDHDGHRIGFAGCRETTYKQDRSIIQRDIEALREIGCEVVVYSCHWGTEYHAAHNELQEEMARAAAEAGADIVVGTHPHVVQGVHTVDDTLVLYSLGNLMFGGTHDLDTFDATLAQLRLRFDGEGYRGCSLELIPILVSGSAPENDFRPVIAQEEDKLRILEKIQLDSSMQLCDTMWFPHAKEDANGPAMVLVEP